MINSKATHLLIRHQEIALKGRNRPDFERRLKNNLSRCVGDLGDVRSVSGRFVIALKQPATETLVEQLAQVSGVAAVTPCLVLAPEFAEIESNAIEWARIELEHNPKINTIAVRTRRVDRKFPLSSAEVDFQIGAAVKRLRDGLTVNLKRPDLKLSIELRNKHALIYSWEKQGVCGLPMDATQRVVCLLSGGIDSPVSTYEVMRRGCTPVLVHFHSKPFTSEASVDKVKRLATIIRKYSPYPLELWLVPLLEIQKAVRDTCNERYRTVHYRRFMMMAAQELANRRGAQAIVTGEALGQVASQTLTNMRAIEDSVQLPVLRPLVTSDKAQIIARAKQIGTYEVSIEPHDDTCVLFAPDKPATQAKLEALREEASALPQYELIFRALDQAEKHLISS